MKETNSTECKNRKAKCDMSAGTKVTPTRPLSALRSASVALTVPLTLGLGGNHTLGSVSPFLINLPFDSKNNACEKNNTGK